MRRRWTSEEVEALGTTTDLETGASCWNIGRTLAYELARNGEFPSPVVKVRGRYVVLVRPMLRALGIDDDHDQEKSDAEPFPDPEAA